MLLNTYVYFANLIKISLTLNCLITVKNFSGKESFIQKFKNNILKIKVLIKGTVKDFLQTNSITRLFSAGNYNYL